MPSLAYGRKWINLAPMKLALAVLVYALIGLVLSWGILLLLAGKPWLFIVAFLTYLVAFGKIGCTET
jgi:F0F1-type ATP synthase assembly protein I